MSNPLTPTQAHAQLDENGWLDAAAGPGCYALRLADPPDDPRAVFEQWTAHHDAAPQWIVDGLADAGDLAYVGASGASVYDRVMDHCEGEVRQTAVMRCYPPTEVLGVRAVENPMDGPEYNYGKEWVENGFAVWMDGRLHGL